MSLLFLALSFFALAQNPEAPRTVEPGVMATTLMDRGEVRILRVEIAPGASRSVHTHTDVNFHVMVPISGAVQLAVGSEKPVEISAGKAQFFRANTPHGWRNTGTAPAILMEVFVKGLTSHEALAALP